MDYEKKYKCLHDYYPFGESRSYTAGKIYNVLRDDQGAEWITNDNGHSELFGYLSNHFELVEESVSGNIDFEQELYKAFGQVKDFTLGVQIAKWFYEMGKNSQEPISDDLEKAAKGIIKNIEPDAYHTINQGSLNEREEPAWSEELVLAAIRAGVQWQKEQEYTCYEEAFEDGALWKIKNLWKPADGNELPEIDREVVVLTQKFPNDAGIMSVAIGHRPNPDGWDGKSIATGKIEHYTPMTYGKGGWNIPDVKWWLDCSLPNMEED